MTPLSFQPNTLCLIAKKGGQDGVVHINQDIALYCAVLEAGHTIEHPVMVDRHSWVQIVRGSLVLNGVTLQAGDGAAVSEEPLLSFSAGDDSEFLLFDLA